MSDSESRVGRGFASPTDPQDELVGLEDSTHPTTIALSPQPLALNPPDIHLAGLNSALQRLPRVEAETVPLIKAAPVVVGWKPTKPRVQTYGLTFPEGLTFLPPPEPKPEKLERIKPPQVETPTGELI